MGNLFYNDLLISGERSFNIAKAFSCYGDFYIKLKTSTKTRCNFLSIWNPPINFLKSISNKFPNVILTLRYTSFDSREYGVLRIKAGIILDAFRDKYNIFMIIVRERYTKLGCFISFYRRILKLNKDSIKYLVHFIREKYLKMY